MPAKSTARAEPSVEALAGPQLGRLLQRLLLATRPKFFPASVLPVLLGSVWGYRVGGEFDALVFLLALAATVCVHAAANVLNDVSDEIGGTDGINTDRIYPYTGGSRFIQNGIMSLHEMTVWGTGLLVLAALLGLALVALRDIAVLLFGIAGLLLAVAYSLPPIRLSGRGVGEAAVGIAFGMLPVTGAAWLQSDVVDARVLVISLPVSLWVAAILLMNEVPDIAADSASGKNTLPVRLGRRGARTLYLGLHAVAFAAVGAAVLADLLRPMVLLLPAVLLLGAVRAAAAIDVRPAAGEEGQPALRAAIETTLGIHTLGSVWLIGWIWFAARAVHAV